MWPFMSTGSLLIIDVVSLECLLPWRRICGYPLGTRSRRSQHERSAITSLGSRNGFFISSRTHGNDYGIPRLALHFTREQSKKERRFLLSGIRIKSIEVLQLLENKNNIKGHWLAVLTSGCRSLIIGIRLSIESQAIGPFLFYRRIRLWEIAEIPTEK